MLRSPLPVAFLASLSLSLLAPPRASAEEVKIATLAPKGSSWAKAIDRASREIEDKTQGRVKLKFFYGGQQGDERDFVRKMKLGQVDGAAVTAVGLALIREDIKVLELPFLFKNEQEVDYVRGKMFPEFEKKFDEAGYVVLTWSETGWVHIYTAVPLQTKADLASLRMWAWVDDATARELFKRMGVNGVPLGVPDVLPSLQTGLINGCYGSPQVAVAFQWYSKVKYASARGFVFSTAALVLRKNVLEKMSAADQKTVRDVFQALGVELTKINRRDNQRARKAMERAGVHFVEFGPDLTAEFEKQGKAIWDVLVGKIYSRDLLERVKKHVAEVRK